MPSLIDRLEHLTITVTSPDANLKATADSERHVEFTFLDEDAYYDYDIVDLERQLRVMLRAVAAGLRHGFRQAYESAGRGYDDAAQQHWDADRRRFRTALAEVEIVGSSPDGAVRITSSGALADYTVRIDPVKIVYLDADAFLRELRLAHATLLADRLRQRAALIKRHLPN